MSSRRFTSKNVLLNKTALTLGENVTDEVVTGSNDNDGDFLIKMPFLAACCIDLVCSGVAAGAGITAQLQVRQSNSADWVNSKSVSITADGIFTLKFLDTVAGDQTYLPLRPLARILITTGAGSALTLDAIWCFDSEA